jgi:predicted RNA-binding Zn-ribbon protein involved in translation (DUF1610 family)
MDEIHFYCIACGANLTSPADSAGGLCDCPRCERVTPIPPATTGRIQPATDILAIEIKFRTDCCGSKARADSRSQGLTFTCPNCQVQAQVPLWNGLPPVAPPSAAAARPTTPIVRLSDEELAFLTAPLRERSPNLSATDN